MRDEIRDESGPWRLEDVQPSEAWPVLDALVDLPNRMGWERGLTKLEARLSANIRAANPSLNSLGAYSEARWYIAHRHRTDWMLNDMLNIAHEAREARKTSMQRRNEHELARIKKTIEEDRA